MRFTTKQKSEIVKLFIKGKSLREIAEQFGVKFHQIRFVCIEILGEDDYWRIADKHRGLVDKRARSDRPNNHKEIRERNTLLLEEYVTGVPVGELAANYNLSVKQVYKIIGRKFGSKPRANTKVKVLYDNYIQVAEMVANNCSVVEIANRFHLTYNMVYFWLLRNVSSELLHENIGIGHSK